MIQTKDSVVENCQANILVARLTYQVLPIGIVWRTFWYPSFCPSSMFKVSYDKIQPKWSRVSHCILPCYEAYCCLNNISMKLRRYVLIIMGLQLHTTPSHLIKGYLGCQSCNQNVCLTILYNNVFGLNNFAYFLMSYDQFNGARP
eukprot:sb/3473917/